MASLSSASAILSIPTICGANPRVAKQDLGMSCSSGQGMSFPSVAHPGVPSVSFRAGHRKSSEGAVRLHCHNATADGLIQEKETVAVEEKVSELTPSTEEVHSLLQEVCDKTRITELKLKVGGFQLHMKREVGPKAAAPAPRTAALPQVQQHAAPPVTGSSSPAASPSKMPPKPNNSTSSLLPMPLSRTASLFGLLEAAADQGLSFVTSPKVGVFRRARKMKGKTGKNLVEEGLIITEGQVIGYLEQLGTKQPIESQVSGEVVQVLWQDGDAVGYGDPLVSIRPSFPGIVSRAALN